MPCNHIIHIVVFTQVQLQQIDFHFTVLHKHAMLYYLKVGPTKKKKKTIQKTWHIKQIRQNIQACVSSTEPLEWVQYLPDNGLLPFKTAIPADKLGPCLCGHQDIVQLIYEVVF